MPWLPMKVLMIALAGVVILTGGYVLKRGYEILSRLERAEENVRALQLARETTERLLLEHRRMEDSIRSARHENNRKLEETVRSTGTADTDALRRMLEEDAAARRDRAAARTAGAMPGAGKQLPGTGIDRHRGSE